MVKHIALRNRYELDRTIGSGGFAKVKLATHLVTGEKVAIKIMDKSALNEDLPRVQHEIKALKTLSHPNICKLYELIETDTHYLLVFEYCSGGELFDHIVEKKRLSESEARVFFRQIISAVAYFHSKGFAHRDLKPENILLDKDQNLKLIDFGLCVQPDGGLKSYLLTSCGSPTYAAPELVLGEKYLGPQVDIWSLGVLLYALLCGSLPFDDNNISNLYKQILSGIYLEPDWLSIETKLLMKSLMQVNPAKRITTEELCRHPWIMKDQMGEIIVLNNAVELEYDEECLSVLSKYYYLHTDEMWAKLLSKNYDYYMSTYKILLAKKRNGHVVNLIKNPVRTRLLSSDSSSSEQIDDARSPHRTRRIRSTRTEHPSNTNTYVINNSDVNNENKVAECESGVRKGQKRTRSPTRDVPMKKCVTNKNRTPVVKSPQTPHETPRIQHQSSTRRRVLESIEKGFNMARLILTPRRSSRLSNTSPSRSTSTPVTLTVKELSNVSTTSSTTPEDVLGHLKTILDTKRIGYTQRGFTLRGKVRGQTDSATTDTPTGTHCKLSFELEVCWVPGPCGNIVGIRRNRLKGDVWIYKTICEQVLAMTSQINK